MQRIVEANAQDGVVVEQVPEVILPLALVWQVVRLGRNPACNLGVVGDDGHCCSCRCPPYSGESGYDSGGVALSSKYKS